MNSGVLCLYAEIRVCDPAHALLYLHMITELPPVRTDIGPQVRMFFIAIIHHFRLFINLTHAT